MNMRALGAYLFTLRDQRKLVAAQIADHVGTSPTHIWRIEQGKIRAIGAELLHRLTAEVGGSAEDIHRLLLDRHATVADGQTLAEQRLGLTVHDNSTGPFNSATEQAIQRLVGRLTPQQRALWVQIGELLLEHQDRPGASDELPSSP
ncbi:MAG: helix-turn-helix domain-containing protein [Chloroflexales bacterium]|nr:helix-turn-helix domain-containing protein [Chloroflexales bacterium]